MIWMKNSIISSKCCPERRVFSKNGGWKPSRLQNFGNQTLLAQLNPAQPVGELVLPRKLSWELVATGESLFRLQCLLRFI